MIRIEKLQIAVLSIFFLCCVNTVYAQSCDQTYSAAKDLYNKGQFNRALDLLNPCIAQYKSNSQDAKSSSNLVFRLFKLYIASCNQAYDTGRAKTASNDLANIFGMSLEQVGQKLDQTAL